MVAVTHVQRFGRTLYVLFDDGTRLPAYPTNTSELWLVSGTPGGGTVDPPDPGTYAVVWPCAVHNVSDSFQDHVDRGSVNPGTDYTAAYGDTVYSVAAGVVTDADNDTSGSGGRTVHVDHDDGTGADYLHLSAFNVTIGQHVAQGEPIASVGDSANGEHGGEIHLHISYRPNHSHGYGGDGNIDFDAYIISLGVPGNVL